MRKLLRMPLVFGLLLGAFLLAGRASALSETAAETALPSFLEGMEWFPSMEEVPSARVGVVLAEGEPYLFLPSCADLRRLSLYYDGDGLTAVGTADQAAEISSGVPFDLTALFPDGEPTDGVYTLTLTDQRGETAALYIMRSAQQAALWLTSDDPENHGRAWVESAEEAERLTATGSMAALTDTGAVLYNGGLRELRGRGNTTWAHSEKKPYQIKLEEKADLLQNGNDNAARTWVLLAEAFDGTLLHNTISLGIGQALGLRGTPECRPVDLYYDGAYRGYYLLCEKVQVDEARLDISEYAYSLEKENPELDDRDIYPLAEEQNDYGNAYQYAEGLKSGERRAFLIELDKFSYRKDDCWFITYDASTGLENPFALKSPDAVPYEDAACVSCLMQELIDCAVNGGENPITGEALEAYIDIDSLARYLLVHQLANTADLGSASTNFYWTDDDELFYPGPIWDFDIAYGIRGAESLDGAVTGNVPQEGWMRELMKYPQLQQRMREVFFAELEPLISGTLLAEGEKASGALMSLDSYEKQIQASYRMNAKLWKRDTTDVLFPTMEENIAYLRAYLTERCQWLREDMALWFGDCVERVGLRCSTGGAETTAAAVNAFPHYIVSGAETTAEADGSRTVRITLLAEEGIAFEKSLTAAVNGEEAEVTLLDERTCEILWKARSE